MYKLINGWTKETVMAQVKKYNDGSRATKPKKGEVDTCSYLTPNGNRCAVGCFIPDGHEGLSSPNGACTLVRTYKDLAGVMPFSADQSGGLLEFQRTHDDFRPDDDGQLKDVHEAIQNFLDTQVE